MDTDQDTNNVEKLTLYWTESQSNTLLFIRTLVRDRHDAEDVLQQTALTIAKRFSDFDQSRPFLPWAIGIARLKVLEHYRRRNRQVLMLETSAIDEIASVCAKHSEERGPWMDALESCLQRITGKSRALIDMRYAQSMGVQKIALKLGTTANTVSNALSRIRVSLRDCVREKLASNHKK